MAKRYYITTPIYYVNAAPHVGTAYTTLAADAFARYHALRGEASWFLTGTDEHGMKLEREARKRGMGPRAFVDEMSARFREVWPILHVRPDDFIRSTEPRHMERVQKYWSRCVARGDIYLGKYTGLYCVSCEDYYTEKDLREGRLCPVHDRPVEMLEEETYFFRLSAYAQRLLDFYERNPGCIRPETRRNEVLAFVREGLRDLSLSRTSFSWGIPVPGDPKHVIYVWFDALFNYLTALEDGPRHEQFWPPDVQLLAKDILRFHAVYWPAFLMSAGMSDAELPRTIFSHGWINMEGKISKTVDESSAARRRRLGTTDPKRIAEILGADILRYFLLREVSFGEDGEFSHVRMIARARADLSETVGNLLHRALPFVTKYFDGKVPYAPRESLTDVDTAVIACAAESAKLAASEWDAYAPHRALEATIDLARAGNRYFDENAPWVLAKNGDTARLATVLYHVFELLRSVSVQLWPAIPERADALRTQLGLDALTPRVDADLWPLPWGGLAAHTAMAPGEPVFPRFDKVSEAALLRDLGVEDDVVERVPAKQKARTQAVEQPSSTDGSPGVIDYDADFSRIDLRLGKVVAAEKVLKADKLLKLTVDLGEPGGPRIIVAGIALSYTAEAMVGRQIVVVANLAPKVLRGITSHGMLLACGPNDALSVVTIERDCPPGTRVK